MKVGADPDRPEGRGGRSAGGSPIISGYAGAMRMLEAAIFPVRSMPNS